jgi:hypothetical protein
MKLSELKVGDVLLPKRAKVPKQVVRINYKRYNGDVSNTVDSVSLQPMESWQGVTYNAKSSYSSTLYNDRDLNNDYNYGGNVNEVKGNGKMNKLFKVIGEEVYGIHIGTNTAGELVLEIRGDTNNAIKAFKKELLEEVKPYTIKLVNITGTGGHRHVTVEKDKVSKNDVIVWSGAVWTVVELDTKQDNCPEINAKNAKRLLVGEL